MGRIPLRDRHLDDGQPLTICHEDAVPRRGFAMDVVMCSARYCPCTSVSIRFARLEREADEDDRVLVELDLADGSVRSLRDGAGLLEAPVDEAWLRRRLADDLGRLIAERQRRQRAQDDRSSWQQYPWAAHVDGEVVAHCELFPEDWDLLVGPDRLWLLDQHCVRPRCACKDVVVDGVTAAGLRVGQAVLRMGGEDHVKVVRCDAELRADVDDALRDHGLRRRLHRRFEQTRRVARLLATWSGDQQDPDAVVERMLARRDDPARDELDQVRALGALAIPALARSAADPGAALMRRARAVRLLAAVELPACAPALVAALMSPELVEDDLVIEDAVEGLAVLSTASIEPLLAAVPTAGAAAEYVIDALAQIRRPDPRVLALLAEWAPRDLGRWAPDMAYQGPAGLQRLHELLAQLVDTVPLNLAAATTIVDALEDAGEPVADAVLAQVQAAAGAAKAAAAAERRREIEERQAVRARAQAELAALDRGMPPGRNQPCRCGSGEKYKKCHLAGDEAARRALVEAAMTGSLAAGQ